MGGAAEGDKLKQRLSRRTAVRAAVPALVAAALAVAVLVPSFASGKGPGPTANTVYIEGSRTEPLRFVAPETIVNGEELTIVNKTIPKQVGPHTFSLVEKSLRPETAKQRKTCFPKGICGTIAKWHGVKGPNSPPTKNPVKAGNPGWSTEGNRKRPGDSWFTGEKPRGKITEKVNVDTSEGPVTLHFMCAIHPWMQGEITVLPSS
jgi:hypothetical protein